MYLRVIIVVGLIIAAVAFYYRLKTTCITTASLSDDEDDDEVEEEGEGKDTDDVTKFEVNTTEETDVLQEEEREEKHVHFEE